MKTIKHILAVIDDTPRAESILEKSLELSETLGAKLIVLHTIHIPFLKMPAYVQDVPVDKAKIKASIDQKVATLQGERTVEHHTLVYFGDGSERAIVEAKRDGVDLIVAGSDMDFDKVIREAQKPILVVNDAAKPYRNILIPTDLSEKSKHGIAYAKALFEQSSMRLVYGYERIAMVTSMYDISYADMLEYQRENREISENLLKSFIEEVKVEGELVDATFSLATHLVEYIEAKQPDLVVVASGSSDDIFNFGSISGYIAQESSKDVLIYA